MFVLGDGIHGKRCEERLLCSAVGSWSGMVVACVGGWICVRSSVELMLVDDRFSCFCVGSGGKMAGV